MGRVQPNKKRCRSDGPTAMTVRLGRRVSAKISKKWSHLIVRSVAVKRGQRHCPLGNFASGRSEDASRDAPRAVSLALPETTSRVEEAVSPITMLGRAITTSSQSRGIPVTKRRATTMAALTAGVPTRPLAETTKVAPRPTARRGGAVSAAVKGAESGATTSSRVPATVVGPPVSGRAVQAVLAVTVVATEIAATSAGEKSRVRS